jgi:hypothetical protein
MEGFSLVRVEPDVNQRNDPIIRDSRSRSNELSSDRAAGVDRQRWIAAMLRFRLPREMMTPGALR